MDDLVSTTLGEVVVVPERAGREGDQPLPTPGAEDVLDSLERRIPELEASGFVEVGTSAFVLPLLRARVAIGVKRYGRRLETFNTRDACADKLAEDLDGIMYGEQVRLQYVALEARLAHALEQLRTVDALRLAAEQRATKAEADLVSHVAALDAVISDLKAQLAASRSTWEAERAALEAETSARIQIEQRLLETRG
jgi:hypothetical protein